MRCIQLRKQMKDDGSKTGQKDNWSRSVMDVFLKISMSFSFFVNSASISAPYMQFVI